MSTFTPEPFVATFEAPAFRDAVADVAVRTSAYWTEHGFAAYWGENGVSISDILNGYTFEHTIEDTMQPSIQLAEVLKRTPTSSFRDDITVVLHSHPDSMDMTPPAEALTSLEAHEDFRRRSGDFAEFHRVLACPSDQDTVVYGSINRVSVGHIMAVLATAADEKSAALFLTRHPERVAPIVSPIDIDTGELTFSKPRMVERMTEAGYLIAETDFDLRTLEFSDDIGNLALQLFP